MLLASASDSVAAGRIDHLVVAAPELESGATWVHEKIGFLPQAGGEHALMGTHNRVLRLGDSTYLEVIAPNPQAPAPARPRWFGLDSLAPDSPPRLAAWVVRTQDIESAVSVCSESLGAIEPMSRGALSWLITIPADGAPPLGGAAPALIEWHTAVHPATAMHQFGLSLDRLELFHPEPQRVTKLLQSLRFDGPVSVSKSEWVRLIARVLTPDGPREL